MNNKLGKHSAMLRNPTLARCLPPTRLATKANVRGMLGEYRAVYIKPNNGTGGFGIYKLSHNGNIYQLQKGTKRRTFATFNGAYTDFTRTKGKRNYLVQKGIPLLHYKDRPFDLRIMVQLNPQGKWEVTGIVGRLAKPHMVVTNYHNGGKPMPVHELLSPFMDRKKLQSYLVLLKDLGTQISRHMNGTFPRFRAYGVDIGIDKELKPWIIEVNTKPDKNIFYALADKRMFRKIMRYAELRK